MYKVGIIGYFAEGKSKAGGQEAKTCALYRAMREKYGKDDVYKVDTTDWKKKPLSLLARMIFMTFKCKNIIMLPAQNSIKIYMPFFGFINILFRRKLYYSVVGGWLPTYLRENAKLLNKCKRLDGIFVETKSMENTLTAMGFENISVIPNFKYLKSLDQNDVDIRFEKPYKLCTFSRVMLEKGIEDIINAVRQINNESNSINFTLDIYGKVDDGYTNRFAELKNSFPSYIKYAGMVEPDQSVETIRDYFALVFPTHYYTEGVPGTLIDASMAGVPVISALWGNYDDVFIEGKTGWGYEFGNQEALLKVLKKALNYPEEFCEMRKSTITEAKRYLPDSNIEKIVKDFN